MLEMASRHRPVAEGYFDFERNLGGMYQEAKADRRRPLTFPDRDHGRRVRMAERKRRLEELETESLRIVCELIAQKYMGKARHARMGFYREQIRTDQARKTRRRALRDRARVERLGRRYVG